MKIHCSHQELVNINDLKPHPMNRNDHPKDQVKRLSKILEYQGWRYPIKVSKRSGFITSGHGRIEAARYNKWKEVPVDYQDYDSDEQEYADVQSDNAIASWAELDLSTINSDIQDLGPDFDIDLLGIKNFVLEPAEFDPQCDEDHVPEPKETRAKAGDLWKLGDHFLMCGDSTNPQHLAQLTDGKMADICFTSPPYNLGSNARLRGKNATGKDHVYVSDADEKSQNQFLSFLTDWTSLALGHAKYVFCNIQLLAGNKIAICEYLFRFKNNLVDVVVWDKVNGFPAMAENVLNSHWEFIFIFSSEQNPKRTIKSGDRFRGTIKNIFHLDPRSIKKDELASDHGAVFPVAFAEHFISNFTKDSVLDVFGGSGTTLIAAEKLRRKSFTMEIDPHYCDVILARWEKYTGKIAELLNGTR